MAEEQTKAFNELQTDLIGPEEEATLNPPTWDENGVLRGGTWFERTGTVGINQMHCYPSFYNPTFMHDVESPLVWRSFGFYG